MPEMTICLLFCITVSLWVLNIRCVAGRDRYYQPGDITLGGLFSLHYAAEDGKCGDFFAVGLARAEAFLFAIDKINRNPNLLPNISLGYDIRDVCGGSANAMEHTYDFVRRNDIAAELRNVSCSREDHKNASKNKEMPIAAVIGPSDSGSALLVGSLLQVVGIPVISESATSNELSSPRYRHFFRTAPPNSEQASAVADVIEHFNWSYVAAVATDDSYGRNAVRELESEAERRKTFCLSFAEFIPREVYNTKLTRAVSELKGHPNIRVVMLWLFGSYGREFLKEAAKQKLFDRTWIFSDGFASKHYLKNEDQRIIHGSLGVEPPYFHNGEFEDFLIKESFNLKSFNRDSAPWWKEFWQKEDINNCSSTESPNERNLCMEIVLRTVYSTYIPYVVDAVSAVAHALHDMKNCSASQCEDTGEAIDPVELEKYLRLVDFQGLTGRIRFDDFGDPVSSSYDIVHFQVSDTADPVKLVIGSWDKSRDQKLQVNVAVIKWNTMTHQQLLPKSFCSEDCPAGTFRSLTTACCWECYKCPSGTVSTRLNDVNCTECPRDQMPDERRSKCLDLPEMEVNWSSLTSVFVVLFATVGLVLVAICSFILNKHRKTPIVKAANRELSTILMLAIAMSFSVSFLSLSKPTNFTCSLVHFWRSMVLVTFISILIIKTMKILSAFQINAIAERLKKFILATKCQSLIVLTLISIPGVLLTLWIALDSPRQQRVIQPIQSTVLLSCSLHQTSVGMALQIAISVYTSFLVIVCTLYAFKARTLPENFNEARYIGFSMYILLLSSVGYLPINIGLKGSYATLLTCAMTLLSSYGLLTCMFGPKIYMILLKPEQNTQEAVSSQVSEYSFRSFGKSKIAVQSGRSDATTNQNNLHLEVVCARGSRN